MQLYDTEKFTTLELILKALELIKKFIALIDCKQRYIGAAVAGRLAPRSPV